MGFVNYFLIVSDYVDYAKRSGIPVGPGRGSAAGSMVSYCLYITDIDPLKYSLYFERFLNPGRVTMPDIDIDFCVNRRQEVIDYVTRKYGKDNVAQIVTFGTMKAKGAVRDVGRALGMSYGEVDQVARLVPGTLNITLTDALNRGAFEKILNIYEGGEKPFAMIICDIDIFKQVNDLHGHTVGDLILKKVARLLTTTFRSIDYVCRIGGDEFAVIMVDVGRELSHTVSDKIELINDALSNPTDGLPAVSLSVGVAFSDCENPGESIFKDADQALYRVKQNGKHDCGFY